MNYDSSVFAGIGMLTLAEEGGILREIRFGEESCEGWIRSETETIARAKRELDEYFRGRRRVFTVPHQGKGTAFQQKVWKVLEEIPYGETRSYKEVADAAGNVKACRAVGMANHANPLPIIVPCHRVIGADGSLTGYGGGLDIKRRLLTLEGISWRE